MTTNTVAATGLVVTQFAVPVAVPQYTVPVAPTSFVQYGGQLSASSGITTEALEDRIVAKVLKGLQASGTIKAAAAPSLVGRACATCHGATNPKAGLSLAATTALTADERLKSISRVLADDPQLRMPPSSSGIKLSAEELGKLLQELSQVPKEDQQ
ncbi:MAG TPA: c-type cytochrome domain-containing protein [Pirellulales bacterium]|nr:c-type cytochrome domain-containing protein [Pirellulales bacterium]